MSRRLFAFCMILLVCGVVALNYYKQKGESARLAALRLKATCYEYNAHSNTLDQICWLVRDDVTSELEPLLSATKLIYWDDLSLTFVPSPSANDIGLIGSLPQLTSLTIPIQSSDPAAALGQCEHLRELYFSNAIDGNHFRRFPEMNALTAVGAENARNADQFVSHLRRSAPKLEWLNLSGSDVTDVGVAEVAGFANLEVLYLDRTAVSREGVQMLQRRSNLTFLSIR